MRLNIGEALDSLEWPFIEALALVKRFEKKPPEKGYILFETGYGPSGLPHIGTFGEVFRTTMIRQVFEKMCDIPTKLIAYSDDMDGLQKVPENIPNRDMVAEYLGRPLTAIPDPFDTHESFGANMNYRFKQFLDQYEFEYEFKSATECYTSGVFDKTALKVLKNYDRIMQIILPTLGKERQTTYAPFMPICPITGRVLMVPVIAINIDKGTITYRDRDEETTILVTGGRCKLQWKPDWGMRWAAFDVDYEMYGKDLIPSAKLSTEICSVIGGTPPTQFYYELFVDEKGAKISKSKGNGISIDEWLRYGLLESLDLFMFKSPRKSKRLYFDVIAKHVDEYLAHLEDFDKQDKKKKLTNPVWHIHNGVPPKHRIPLSFGLLLNLAGVCNPENKAVLWGFITRYAPGVTPENAPLLDQLVDHAIAYYEDFVKPVKQYRPPSAAEHRAMNVLAERLTYLSADATAEDIQKEIYAIGQTHGFKNLRDWFKALYEVLLGQKQGPRMGSFIMLYGKEETIALINHRTSTKPK